MFFFGASPVQFSPRHRSDRTAKMYGMLLESVQHFVQLEYGEEVWSQVLQIAECKHSVFNTHHVYSDSVMANLAAALAKVTSASYDSFMNFFGRCFVRYFTNLG